VIRDDRSVLVGEDGGLSRLGGGQVASDRAGNLFVAGEFSKQFRSAAAQSEWARRLRRQARQHWNLLWVRQLEQAQERAQNRHSEWDVIVMGTGIGTQKLDGAGETSWASELAGADCARSAGQRAARGFIDALGSVRVCWRSAGDVHCQARRR
jgi:hypothetical protein